MKNQINFETALTQIEEIIERFEEETINLDNSIELYKQGTELIKLCQDKLNSVEQQIKILNQDTNKLDILEGN
jgi:exodeoxyribonuclease VII small subunit